MKTLPFISTILLCLLFLVPSVQGQEEAEKANEKNQTPREQISELIKDGKLKKAAESLDDALAQDSGNSLLMVMRRTLASAFSRKRNYEQAATQYAKLLSSRMADPKASAAELVSILSSARVYYPRGGRADDVLSTIEMVEQHVAKTVSLDKATAEAKYLLTLHSYKAQSMQREQSDKAEQLLRDDYQAIQALHDRTDNKISADLLAYSVRNLFQSLPIGEERSDLFATHQQLASKQIEDGNTSMISDYMLAGMSQISRLYRSNPNEAKAIMTSLTIVIEEFEDDEKLKRSMMSYKRSLGRYESRIESALKIAAMYDKPAPPIDQEAAWVGVEKPLALEGKVVLLDFWAIWCGPCIATFPHLQHLKEEYGDKGLEIVGVTRYYNYTWDEDAERTKRGERDAEPDVEAEHIALQRFLASHKLEHPTVVVTKESTMFKQFNVTGIPHAALIDKNGILRMVNVGSGSAGAAQLEERIQELLAEG